MIKMISLIIYKIMRIKMKIWISVPLLFRLIKQKINKKTVKIFSNNLKFLNNNNNK